MNEAFVLVYEARVHHGRGFYVNETRQTKPMPRNTARRFARRLKTVRSVRHVMAWQIAG